ncbi:hypothetical protein [Rhodospirillum centenum]|uniref:Uncharacterized protein n=1 Tax=Rhodospirillum centenum (strain ATCC 51521 / SW) TaxID=414684 RepID=B6IP79_RHOCS|nr:hypothetical protein [Rhodospirillum centenum]ACI99581.1 hypothetical protein RC1_2194 [Rhodospirillum centenum SW]
MATITAFAAAIPTPTPVATRARTLRSRLTRRRTTAATRPARMAAPLRAVQTLPVAGERPAGLLARIGEWVPGVEVLPVLAVAVVQIACLVQIF